MEKQKEVDERDFTIMRELAYDVIKYADRKISSYSDMVSRYIKDKFPEEDIETYYEFDWLLRNKMSDGDIETLLSKME